ncbi:MAG: hypothetical protein EOP90_08870 [Lysobacteraceae bacterium]|nr:MAG: hypothetical protein EOP90_08870 [Xanthomonadaceae bacterium]
MVRLDKPMRREVMVGEEAYTLTIDPSGLKLVQKGRRNGLVLEWQELVSGDAALATALQASLQT